MKIQNPDLNYQTTVQGDQIEASKIVTPETASGGVADVRDAFEPQGNHNLTFPGYRDFHEPLISEFQTPSLDAESKDSSSITIKMEPGAVKHEDADSESATKAELQSEQLIALRKKTTWIIRSMLWISSALIGILGWVSGDSAIAETSSMARPIFQSQDISSADGLNPAFEADLLDQRMRPLALASADFDEDGVPDLIASYEWNGRGLLTLQKGNIDSIYPMSPEAKLRRMKGESVDAPFFAEVNAMDSSCLAQFVGAGDFNADGHADIVVAASHGSELFWFAGDGHGKFNHAERIKLPGKVNAMHIADLNRQDGLPDVAVAVTGRKNSEILVFESPRGALQGDPEIVNLPASAVAMSSGVFGEQTRIDLAVATSTQLIVVEGRDRRLSLDMKARAKSSAAVLDLHSLEWPVVDMIAGKFTKDPGKQFAFLTATGDIHIGLLYDSELEIVRSIESIRLGKTNSGTRLFAARLSVAPIDDIVLMSPDEGNLRFVTGRALDLTSDTTPVAVLPMRLNSDAFPDLVTLNGNGLEAFVSAPAISLTVNTSADHTDGSCDSSDCTFREAIIAANASGEPSQIKFTNLFSQTIVPLQPLPPIVVPLEIQGDTSPFSPVELDGSNAGPAANGLTIDAGNCNVHDMVINRFSGDGIRITSTAGSVLIEGNFIGTDRFGIFPQGNLNGIVVGAPEAGSPDNTIGGTTSAARNVISGNDMGGGGIVLYPGSDFNTIEGNYIGLDASATMAVPNSNGINIQGYFNTIGGLIASSRNIISANNESGIRLIGNRTVVQGNYIGTNGDGKGFFGNQLNGIWITGTDSAVGGTSPTSTNVISNSISYSGVFIDQGADNTYVQGNLIGVSANGDDALGNAGHGIAIRFSPDNNIGGAAAGAGNYIVANHGSGVLISESASVGNLVEGNTIGDIGFGNTLHGVMIGTSQTTFATGNTIEANTIQDNGGDGFRSAGGTGNTLTANLFRVNGGLGIDLGGNGVTLNDPDDPDNGPNNYQNFPVITSATVIDGGTTINGTLNSLPSTTFTVEFFSSGNCDPSGYGEAKTFVGFSPVTTDGLGDVTFSVPFPSDFANQNLTATATDPSGNTSEFSQCLRVSGTCPAITLNPPVLANGQVDAPYGATVTASGGVGQYTYIVSGGALPPGLSLNASTGAITGTPTGTGVFSFTITATDDNGCTGEITYVVTIVPGCPVITLNPPSLPNGTTGVSYSQILTPSGGTAPYGFFISSGSLPPGLALNPESGTISGTPTNGGTFTFTVTVFDANECSSNKTYTIIIVPSDCPGITIQPPFLPVAVLNASYNATLDAVGGNGPYTFSITTGTLPVNLSLNSNGQISGLVLAHGRYPFTVSVIDSNGCGGSRDYVLSVCILCELFDDNVLDPAWTYQGTWIESDGVLTTTANHKATALAPQQIEEIAPMDYQVDLRTAGGGGSRISFLAWYQDNKNYLELMMNEKKNVWILKQRVNGRVKSKSKIPTAILPDTNYTARISRNASDYQVIVDGQLLLTVPNMMGNSPGVSGGFVVKKTTGTFDNFFTY